MLLSEFDLTKQAVINPEDIITPFADMPKVAVSCYSCVTFERMVEELDVEIIGRLSTANAVIPVYRTVYKNTPIALFMAGVGAPMSAGDLEEIYQMGVQKVVLFGSCGVLDQRIEDCSVIIPNCAVRDEGTSYHYAPASDEIRVNERYINDFVSLLEELQISYTIGKVWTTDAIYRETPDKVKRRKEQGCICVDMECSANAAVAAFRGKELLQFFYAADNLDAEKWDARSLRNTDKLDEKDRVAMLALEAAVRIAL